MNARATDALAGVDRRGFIGRVAVGSATALTGMFGFAPKAIAHEEKLTMAAASAARAFGISTYQLRRSGTGTATNRLASQLFNLSAENLGEFVQTIRLRTEIDQRVDPKDPKGEVQNHVKQFILSERTQFSFGGHLLDTTYNDLEGVISVTFDGGDFGTLNVKSFRLPESQRDFNPRIVGLVQTHSRMLSAHDAVKADLRAAVAPREILGCCCMSTCGEHEHSCTKFGWTASSACAAAENCVNLQCWNSLCIGCCSTTCDLICEPIAGNDFICFAYSTGRSCGCLQYCQ